MATYQRIAVATDPFDDGPAIAVASELGAYVGALELLAVSPNRAVARLDRADLERLGAIHGWVPAACTVLIGVDVAATLVRHVGRRDHLLLVLAADGPYSGIVDKQAAGFVGGGDQPILLVGAQVDPHRALRPGALIILVDETAPDPHAIRAIEAWVTTFGADIWAVHTTAAVPELSSEPGRWLDALSRNQLAIARHETLTGDPVERARDLVANTPGAVVVAANDLDHGRPEIVAELLRNSSVALLFSPSRTPGRRSDQRQQHLATPV